MADETNVLDLALPENDAAAATVGDYMLALALTVWIEDEGFSGKRPFGNSGWWYEVCDPIVEAGLAADHDEAHALVVTALKERMDG